MTEQDIWQISCIINSFYIVANSVKCSLIIMLLYISLIWYLIF